MQNEAEATRRILTAERFFRGIWGGDPSVVDELSGVGVVISYPIFAQLYGRVALRGQDAARELSIRFGQEWTEPEVTIEEAISDGDKVVLVWTFRARNTRAEKSGEPPTDQKRSWGGISLFRFDRDGKIVAEIGEESEPGPTGRLSDRG